MTLLRKFVFKSLMLRSQFVQSVVHCFESAQIKLGFEAKITDAQTARHFL